MAKVERRVKFEKSTGAKGKFIPSFKLSQFTLPNYNNVTKRKEVLSHCNASMNLNP